MGAEACQGALTHLLSHCFPTAPCSQSLPEQHRRRRRLRTRRHPQGDEDHQPQVRRRPRVFAFVSAPADKLALSPYPICSSFTVSRTTTTSPTRPSRRSETPWAAVSASNSSKRPWCAAPPSDAPWRARLQPQSRLRPQQPANLLTHKWCISHHSAPRPPPALGAPSKRRI